MKEQQPTMDLEDLRRMWEERRAKAAPVLRRIDWRGMSRPARSPEEHAWLEAHGGSPFVEDEAAATLARAYYRRKYGAD